MRRKSLWTSSNLGKMHLDLRGGSRMSFILVENDARQVCELLTPILGNVRVVDRA
jgi:hypothetical protein